MSRIWGFLVFLLIFHALYFGMNFYVLARMANLFGLKKNLVFYIILTFCTLSLFLATYLERSIGNSLTGLIYFFCALWMGVLFLFFCTLLCYELLHLFVKFNPREAGVVITVFVAVLVLYSMLNTQRLTVKVLEIPATVDMDLVQWSDVHVGSTGAGFLEHIIKKTNELGPDAVLITGDLVDSLGKNERKALQMLEWLSMPVFQSAGNHERYTGLDRVVKALEGTKVRFLRNEVVDFMGIKIIGIDDSDSGGHLEEQFKKISLNDSDFNLLMYHRPVGVRVASKAGVDLMLTGHTHNGQVFPFNYVVGLFFDYMKGFFEVNGMGLYVCPGTGTWGPRMRLGSRCEIVHIKLRKNPEFSEKNPAGL
jgi:predicted MPP superfamily phosphohydrolase